MVMLLNPQKKGTRIANRDICSKMNFPILKSLIFNWPLAEYVQFFNGPAEYVANVTFWEGFFWRPDWLTMAWN